MHNEAAPELRTVVGFNGKRVALAIRAGAWIASKCLGMDDSGEIPATPIRKIPLHALRPQVANAVMQWNLLIRIRRMTHNLVEPDEQFIHYLQ